MIFDNIRQPCWVSPVSSPRIMSWADKHPATIRDHLIVGGRTVWIDDHDPPASIVLSHPNRLGAAEDLAGVAQRSKRFGSEVFVEVDPYLLDLVDVKSAVQPIVHWSQPHAALRAIGERCRLAADAFRRRVAQIPRVQFVVDPQAGRAVSLITPIPGYVVAARLAGVGVLIDNLPLLEGLVIVSLGWWHTKRQIDSLAQALGAVIADREPPTIDDDNFSRLPTDLPKRRLDTI
jgi:hypothetical protein